MSIRLYTWPKSSASGARWALEAPYFESLAILLHLAEHHGLERGLWPREGTRSAEAFSWTVWGTAELRLYTMQYRRLLDMLEARLAGREYLFDAFSLADISPASALFFGTALGATLAGRTNVERWLERCRARPARIRAGD